MHNRSGDTLCQSSDESTPILKQHDDFPGYNSVRDVAADMASQDEVKASPRSVNFCDDQESSDDGKPKNSKTSKFPGMLLSLTIEPLLFVYSLSYFMMSAVVPNMIMDKACYVHLNFSKEICQNLSHYTEEKDEVETMANNYGLYMNLIRMGPAAFFAIFLGQWSDKYGRKPPVIFALSGAAIESIGIMFCTYYFDSRLEYMLLSSIPLGLTGGFICVFTIVYSYASDVTTSRRRTLKYLFVEMAFGLGMSFGSLTAGLLYKYSSYLMVYVVSFIGYLLAILWCIFMVAETRGLSCTEGWRRKLCNVFSIKNFMTGFQVCMEVRENHGRTQIWLLLGSICAVVWSYVSVSSIGYTFVHHMYDWDAGDYSEVNTIFSVTGMIVSIFCVPILIKFLKFDDKKLGILGVLSGILKSVTIALAEKPWIYYLGSGLGIFLGFSSLSVRSLLSKLVSSDELGKIFSFLSACEALVPVLGNIAITKIFNWTLTIFPGTSYMVGAFFLLIPLGTFMWISTLKPRGCDFPSAAEQKVVPNAPEPKV